MYENLKKLIYTRSYDKDEIIKKIEMLMAINQITASEYEGIIDLMVEYPSQKI
ncbi:MAG: hypothetical protein R3Y29_08840 [bacterium]